MTLHARPVPDVRVAIVGSGFAGLGMAVNLGIDDYVVLERASDVGGTSRDNTYPGCECDVPSTLYSFSFAPNPAWTHTYPLQAEIWDYLRGVADDHGVTPHIRYGHEVTAAEWDEDGERWTLHSTGGPLTARGGCTRDRCPVRAVDPADPGPRAVRRHDLPLRSLGPRPRPARRARRSDRDRRLSDPVRPADPLAGR
jgi:hypothetical protein